MPSASALGACHVLGLYLKQIGYIHEYLHLRGMYEHHIQDREAACQEQIKKFHYLARKVFRVFIQHR